MGVADSGAAVNEAAAPATGVRLPEPLERSPSLWELFKFEHLYNATRDKLVVFESGPSSPDCLRFETEIAEAYRQAWLMPDGEPRTCVLKDLDRLVSQALERIDAGYHNTLPFHSGFFAALTDFFTGTRGTYNARTRGYTYAGRKNEEFERHRAYLDGIRRAQKNRSVLLPVPAPDSEHHFVRARLDWGEERIERQKYWAELSPWAPDLTLYLYADGKADPVLEPALPPP
jgi:hypothetical protein